MSAPSAVQGASLLILLQLLSRTVSFVANQLLVRLLTASMLGLATQLDVYYLSVLFFARESLRIAIQRQGPVAAQGKQEQEQEQEKKEQNEEQKQEQKQAQGKVQKRVQTQAQDHTQHDAQAQAVVNLGYLALALGIPVAAALAWLYLASASAATLAAPGMHASLLIYALAAVIELLAEPSFVLMQMRMRFATRAAAESLATLMRCLVVFTAAAAAVRRRVDVGVLPFAMGQLAYACALLAVYLVAGLRLAADDGFALAPRPLGPGRDFYLAYFYRPTMRLAASLMSQSLVKHLLTQGDTFLVSLLATAQVQGVYALANNYGGLVARLVLHPIEESCRSYFSRLLSASAPPADDEPVSAAVSEAGPSFATVARLYLVVAAVVASVGPFAAPPLLALVAGRAWAGAGAGAVLATYCFFIPFLALNGLAESLVSAVISERQVHRQSLWMGVFSVVFAAAAYVLMRVYGLGASGLVWANAINMMCRIVWSAAYIKSFSAAHRADFSLTALLPRATLGVAVCTFAALRQLRFDEAESAPFQTLAKVAATAVPFLFTIVYLERSLLLQCLQSVRGTKQ